MSAEETTATMEKKPDEAVQKESPANATASSSSGGCNYFLVLNTTEGPVPLHKVILSNLRSATLVAMVSLSLSIGLGIASGTGPLEGLRTAMYGGIISGAFGSSPFNIVGPAGALSGMLASYSDKWTPDILPWIAILSGCFSILVLVLGLQKYMLFMPKSVFEGFTTAVGFIIGLKQINHACGMLDLPKRDGFLPNLWESIINLDKIEWGSFLLFLPQFVVMYVLMRYVPDFTIGKDEDKNKKGTNITLPWMVVIPLATIVLGAICDDDTTIYYNRLKEGSLAGSLPDESSGWILPTLKTKFGSLDADLISWPKWKAVEDCDDIPGFIIASLSVCIVAVLETLISAKIGDMRCEGMRENQRGDFNEPRELAAMCGGQLLSGAFGGLPSTGVFVRTSVNLTNGATHPISQLINAIMVLIVTAVAMPLFELLPLASVAAVLCISAIRMIPAKYIVGLWWTDRSHFVLCCLTCILCTCIDPIAGLLAGTFLAFLIQAMRSCKLESAVSAEEVAPGAPPTASISGPFRYDNADAVSRRVIEILEKQSKADAWVIDCSNVTDIDIDGAEKLEKLAKSLTKRAGDNDVPLVLLLMDSGEHADGKKTSHPQLNNTKWYENVLSKEETKGSEDAGKTTKFLFFSNKEKMLKRVAGLRV